ncbi:SafA/ExsA family spore coat assembly protein [Aquibacillus halophilus]|uniref:SafA/ExsA family spore coat assembly protein n=1 Tax=Aquibacillus halophilus TaxID=930132 RepID=A0A6A8DD63_9BACI|nr:SafA/ExsA family spore coat assembly protein [Aquibacillus halophilus]MRH43180.1 SafA/ExsA family spore coat assembly protein [Aquibacillus halophilus]
MKKILYIVLLIFVLTPLAVSAAETYTVQPGDSMWKIAVRYQIGVTEIIEANPQVENPDLIYPNQKLNIPNIDTIKHTEHEVIQLTNQERAKYGLGALKPDWELSRVARYKSQDMHDKNYFSHTSPTYGSPFTMMQQFGINYRSAAENIAKGQRTPQEVVRAWMNSPGHKKNILSADFTHIGVGYVKDGNYWTQMFIKK